MLHTKTTSTVENRFSFSSSNHWVIASLATATLFASVGMMFPGAAMAAENKPVSVAVPSKQVSYGDLDLARPTDIAKLKRRVTRAARALCNAGGVASIINVRQEKRCVEATVAHTLDQMHDASQVLALVQTK